MVFTQHLFKSSTMNEFLLLPNNLPLIISGLTVAALFMLELVALTFGADFIETFGEVELTEPIPDTALQDKNRLPLIIVIFSFLVLFTVIGFVLQILMFATSEGEWTMQWWILTPITAAFSVMLTKILSVWLSRFAPKNYTQSVRQENLIHFPATVVQGAMTTSKSEFVQIVDGNGIIHYKRARLLTDDGNTVSAKEGDAVIIVEFDKVTDEYLVVKA